VAGIDVDFALGVDELNLGKHALRFSADVDDDEFAHHANDHASDDLPFTTKLMLVGGGCRCFKELGEARGVGGSSNLLNVSHVFLKRVVRGAGEKVGSAI